MGIKERVFHAMQHDRTLGSDEAFRLVTEPHVEATQLRDREAEERARTEGDPVKDGAVRCAAKFGIDIVDAYLVARAVQRDARLDAPLAALLTNKDLPVPRAIEQARAEVAGKPSAARVSVSDAVVKLRQLWPEETFEATQDAALRLSTSRGGLEGALAGVVLAKHGDRTAGLSATLDRFCGRS